MIWQSNSVGTYFGDYRRHDRRDVFSALSFLPRLYPGAERWLERRLDDVEEGRANCTVVKVGDCVKGVLIETPKGRRAAKISTIFVSDDWRKNGIASRLYDRHACRWYREEIDRIHITVPAHKERLLSRFLGKRGFLRDCKIEDRYGEYRTEAIYALVL